MDCKQRIKNGEGEENMKIVHISLAAPFNEGWSYHENLLPYWHKKLGNDVVLIARNQIHKNNVIAQCDTEKRMMSNGVFLYRIKVTTPKVNSWSRPNKKEVLEILKKEKPEFIWVHGVMSVNLSIAVNYKQKYDNSVVIVSDNHSDFDNYGNDILRKINLFFIRCRNKRLLKNVSWYYGVTPGRCDFLEKELGVNKDKIKLSIQGGDPDEIDYKNKDIIKHNFIKKHHIPDDSFLYLTGGKLTKDKKLFPLLDSFSKSTNSNNRLIVFGGFASCEEEAKFKEYLMKDKRIIFIGFLDGNQTSEAMLSVDFGIFPGGHSVLWEKALSCGLPCGFGKKEGFEHLYLGNSMQLDEKEETVVFDFDGFAFSELYKQLDSEAKKHRKNYLYDSIADQTLKDFYSVIK